MYIASSSSSSSSVRSTSTSTSSAIFNYLGDWRLEDVLDVR